MFKIEVEHNINAQAIFRFLDDMFQICEARKFERFVELYTLRISRLRVAPWSHFWCQEDNQSCQVYVAANSDLTWIFTYVEACPHLVWPKSPLAEKEAFGSVEGKIRQQVLILVQVPAVLHFNINLVTFILLNIFITRLTDNSFTKQIKLLSVAIILSFWILNRAGVVQIIFTVPFFLFVWWVGRGS